MRIKTIVILKIAKSRFEKLVL